nr:response regulator [Kiloniella sp. EL199]
MARNGAEALTVLKSSENPVIDLILLNINMPIMDGFEFLQNLRKDEKIKSLPIIMCTTSNDDRGMSSAQSCDLMQL